MFFHFNIQSLLQKTNEIRDSLLNVKLPVVLGIRETSLDVSISDGVDGYTVSRRDTMTRGSGVVARRCPG